MGAEGDDSETGWGGDAPIVLVRDLGVPAAAYSDMLAFATSGADHFELDLLADSVSSEMSISRWADALDELLDSIPTVAAVCIGDGVGSLILEHFAATRSDRVARLVLISPLHGLSPEGRGEYSDVAERIADEGVGSFIKWRHAQSTADPELRIADMAIAVTDVDPALLAQACAAVAGAHTSDLSSVKAPALVFADRSSPEQISGSAKAQAELLRSEAIEIAGCGINLSVTNPTELGERVREFIAATLENAEKEEAP